MTKRTLHELYERLDDIADLLKQFLTHMTSVLVESHGGSGFERFTT